MKTLLVVLVAAGCVPGVPDGDAPESLEALVTDHAAASGLDYADCGTLIESFECPSEVGPELQCLLDGFAACEPVRLDIAHATIDAGPIPETVFVEPKDGGCTLVSFQDHSGDGFKGDYGDLIHRECASVDAPVGCNQAEVVDCVTVDEWYL